MMCTIGAAANARLRARERLAEQASQCDRTVNLSDVIAVRPLQVQGRTRARAAIAHEVAAEAAVMSAANHGEVPVALLT